MIAMSELVSIITQIIIFIGLYFSCFWILVLINSEKREKTPDFFPSISLLIPAFNEERGIIRTLESCLRLNYRGEVKIYVVNDASTDSTFRVAKQYEDRGVIVIDKKKNAGKAAALNTALKEVKTDYFAVIDADSTISVNSLMRAVQFFKRNDDQKVGAVISKMRPTNTSKNMLERIQLIEYMMVGLMRFMSAVIYLLHLTPGVLSVYNTKLVKKIGGFDSKNLTEDFELGVKVRKEGYLIEYCEQAEVYTETPNTLSVFLKQRIRWSRGFIQTHKKHKDIFFNSKQGLFGWYQFPMNILGPIFYFLAIFAISYNVYKACYEFIFKLIKTPDLVTFWQFDSLQDIILTLDFKIELLIWMSLFFFFIFIWSITKFYGYNFLRKNFIKNVGAILLYLMVYNYLYIYVWLVSLKKEFFGENYDWGTKQVSHGESK